MEEELEELLDDSYEEDFYQKPINFTPEERARIDRLLAEGEEYQRQHGNKRYTIEEVMEGMRKLMQGDYIFTEEEVADYVDEGDSFKITHSNKTYTTEEVWGLIAEQRYKQI